MRRYFHFGEKVKEYELRVLNEREVRASAGILFLLALIAFMNSWLIGNFYYTKIFVVAFLVDFFIRVIINPNYSPSLILGRLIVGNQEVEYVGAPQKRFAWGIGLGLAAIMFYVLVLNNDIGPVNLLICVTCLLLLFFEAAFGICIGCKIYNLFNKEGARLCPGGVCKPFKREDIQKTGFAQVLIALAFIAGVVSIFFYYPAPSNTPQTLAASVQTFASPSIGAQAQNSHTSANCTAPDWAIAIGHGDLWKLHHGCS